MGTIALKASFFMLEMTRSYRLVEYPSPVSRAAYDDAIDRMAERLVSLEGVAAVYQVGGVSEPGISDIDMVVVFEDGVKCSFDPRENLTSSERYLFVHSLYGTSTHHFENSQKTSFFHNYRLLSGRDCRSTPDSLPAESVRQLKRQIAIEYMLRMFINLAIQSEFGVVKVRSTLLQAKAISYDLEFLSVSSGRLPEIVGNVLELRREWFNNPSAAKEFTTFVREFASSLSQFLSAALAAEEFYLPAGRVRVARSVNLNSNEGVELSYGRSGILLPGFCVRLGPRYYSLQNRLNRFEFTVRASTSQVPAEIDGRFRSIREMTGYNRKMLPHFAPLASSLYQI